MSRRRFPRRWPMLRTTDALASLMPTPRQRSGVLILRMFGIGDALLFRMVLEKYAEALNVPLSQITVLGSNSWAAAAELFFKDVTIKIIDEKRFAKNVFYRLKVMRDIRKAGYQTAICGMRFRYPHVVESLMLASGAPQRIVIDPRPNEKFDAMFAHYRPLMTRVISISEPQKPRAGEGSPLPLMHEIEHELAFLSVVAGKKIELPALPALAFPPGDVPLMYPAERYAVLNIGASHAPRRWPPDHFYAVAEQLQKNGYSVVFLGGPAESNLKPEIESYVAATAEKSGPRIVVSIGDLDLAGSARLVAGAALVISNDSGLGHLALMLGRPSVLIVGGGHYGSFMPYPPGLSASHVYFASHLMPCYHCNWNCTMMPAGGTTFPCVAGVTVEKVWASVTKIIGVTTTPQSRA